MKKSTIHVFALCALAQCTALPLLAADADSQRIVATVNGQELTERELSVALKGAVAASAQTRKYWIEKLIDDALVLQAASKAGYKIPPQIAKEAIDTIVKEEFGGDYAKFEERLKLDGYSIPEFGKRKESEIMLQAMRRQLTKGATGAAAKKEAMATWLALARKEASLTYP